MKKLLFIDRDGTLVLEPFDNKVDSFEKLNFYPHVFEFMGKIARELDYEPVMVTNQDGLGTASFPENNFWSVQNFIIKLLESEGIHFQDIFIDRTFPEEKAPTRKPGVGLLSQYFNKEKYNLVDSFVIGDRITDVLLAKNLGCQAIWINNDSNLGAAEVKESRAILDSVIALETTKWSDIYTYLKLKERRVEVSRITKETDIAIKLNIDGKGDANISTGIGFFDHMLEQIAKHAQLDLNIHVTGDLHIDEHHSIEDTGIALGQAFDKALQDKRGMERYGYCLPMDDCLAQAAIDFGGRSWLVWDVSFKREKVGEMPTEMIFHFFKSFSDASKSNINIKAEGENDHHKIEAIFKAFAKSVKQALRRDPNYMQLPSTKGVL